MRSIDDIFKEVMERSASDLIFVPGAPPVAWVAGRMAPLEAPELTSADIETMFMPLLDAPQREKLDHVGDLDFSVGKQDVGRLRVNMHRQRGTWSVAIRFIPHKVPAFETLCLPPRVLQLADLPHGLVLVTGGAGSGKSTTLAAMINYMNQTHRYHVITLEDPLEFTYRHGTCIIEQREVGVDCSSFASALRHVVRQRPDVIMVGEMRDLETISAALTAAETGHLVLASLHTINAVQTIDRIIDIFPAAQQVQVRVQVGSTLQGVVCQTMFHNEKNDGLVPACEIMISTPAIRRAIRDNETHLLQGMLETGRQLGMQSMDASIAALASGGYITPQIAQAKAHNPEKLAKMIAA